MKPPWAGKRRDANEREIVEALREAGASVWRLQFVDLLVAFRGQWYVAEVKTEKGKLGRTQSDLIVLTPAPIHVWRTPEEALSRIGAIT